MSLYIDRRAVSWNVVRGEGRGTGERGGEEVPKWVKRMIRRKKRE